MKATNAKNGYYTLEAISERKAVRAMIKAKESNV